MRYLFNEDNTLYLVIYSMYGPDGKIKKTKSYFPALCFLEAVNFAEAYSPDGYQIESLKELSTHFFYVEKELES